MKQPILRKINGLNNWIIACYRFFDGLNCIDETAFRGSRNQYHLTRSMKTSRTVEPLSSSDSPYLHQGFFFTAPNSVRPHGSFVRNTHPTKSSPRYYSNYSTSRLANLKTCVSLWKIGTSDGLSRNEKRCYYAIAREEPCLLHNPTQPSYNSTLTIIPSIKNTMLISLRGAKNPQAALLDESIDL